MPCPFASLLGVPNEGFHALRIGDFAFNDIAGTIVIAIWFSNHFRVPLHIALISWFAFAEALHIAFGVHTAFLKKLGIKPYCE